MEHTQQLITIGKDYLVWHYTSPDVFIKLLNDEMYATHFKFLNDDMEISYAQKVCQDFINNELHVKQIDSFCEDLLNQDIFVMCFSTVKDSLSQWRSYTPRSLGGFAIGFSKNKLCSALNGTIRDNISWNWIKCRYSEDQLHKRLQALKRIIERNANFRSSARQNQENDLNGLSLSQEQMKKENQAYKLERFIQECISDCDRECKALLAFTKMSLMYKHPTFVAECEERILGFGMNFKAIGEGHISPNIQSFHRNEIEYIGGKPRIRIPITSVRDCIEYVMVSPHGKKKENKFLAELFRDKYDLKFNIEMSSSPYNGR